jgi:Ca2+-binding EF-hand superfamily protein
MARKMKTKDSEGELQEAYKVFDRDNGSRLARGTLKCH